MYRYCETYRRYVKNGCQFPFQAASALYIYFGLPRVSNKFSVNCCIYSFFFYTNKLSAEKKRTHTRTALVFGNVS